MVTPTGLLRKTVLALVPLVFLATAMMLTGSGTSGSGICAEGDLDGDGLPEEYSLADHFLIVKEGGHILWESPSDFRVDSFALGDVDNDGTYNLVISLWKNGSFGEMKPFWHTDRDISYKNHLFVYKLKGNKYSPVWCSSDLDRPILSFEIRDINGDSMNELVAVEGQYGKTGGSGRTYIWQWQEWGFSRVGFKTGVLQTIQ